MKGESNATIALINALTKIKGMKAYNHFPYPRASFKRTGECFLLIRFSDDSLKSLVLGVLAHACKSLTIKVNKYHIRFFADLEKHLQQHQPKLDLELVAPQTLYVKPQTVDPRPQTLNLRPQTLNLRPQTLDVKPLTLDSTH